MSGTCKKRCHIDINCEAVSMIKTTGQVFCGNADSTVVDFNMQESNHGFTLCKKGNFITIFKDMFFLIFIFFSINYLFVFSIKVQFYFLKHHNDLCFQSQKCH